MKSIYIQPYKVSDPNKFYGYPVEMYVINSDHPRFQNGTRFDYGFHSISMEEGYSINYLPILNEDPKGKE